MAIVSMKALLESGVHFGHRTHKWHPHMKSYIFTERNSIHIIDLQQTVKALEEAYELVRGTVADGGTVLFVGTKRQAQDTIQTEATRCGMPWVTARWLGGTLTNWRTIRQRINELDRLERERDRGEFARLTKKEALGLHRKIERLEMLIGGIRDMIALPDLLFVVDVRREETSVHEANLLEIPVVAMVDTNCDPRNVDYVIPSNDDAIRAIKLIVGKMADAVLEGQAMRKEEAVAKVEVKEEEAVEEVELTDEELLGEATLAKLEAQREEEAKRFAVETEEVEQEEAEAAPSEEAEVEETEEEETSVEAEEVAVEAVEEEEPPSEELEAEEPPSAEAGETEVEEVEAEETPVEEEEPPSEELEAEEPPSAEAEEAEVEEVEAEETPTDEAEDEDAEAEEETQDDEPEAESDEADEELEEESEVEEPSDDEKAEDTEEEESQESPDSEGEDEETPEEDTNKDEA